MHTRRPGILYFVTALLLAALLGAPPAAQTGGKGQPAGKAINIADYDELVRQLQQKVSSKTIIEALQESPTHFTLSDDQVKTLQKNGATPELIAELRKMSVKAVPSDVRKIGIVLDCSGSMLDKLPDKTTKMDVAKKVVIDFVRKIRNGKQLTFVVYGLNPKLKCDDIQVLLPLTEVTDEIKDKLVKEIEKIIPLGQTPLAKAMEVAGAELEKGVGMAMLVVVTDGMESCKGDPGAVAKMLDQKLQLGGIHLIGLGVEAEEMAALKKLASASLVVVDVNKGIDLQQKLDEAKKIADQKAKEADERIAQKIADTVKAKGGKTGQLEISLAWFNKNDLDLHVTPPAGDKEKIFYAHRESKDGGKLDVDMNVVYDQASMSPVEHVVWDKKAPHGHYKVLVHHYKNHGKPDTKDPTRFVVQIRYKGQVVETFRGEVSNPGQRSMLVTEFTIDQNGEYSQVVVGAAPPPKKDTPKK
jgi:Mg-chelatase subunit ChlD